MRISGIIALACSAAALTCAMGCTAWADDGGTDLGGANRYETSINVALESYPDGCDNVIIATGENFPDALSASGLAGLLDCPILLTRTDEMTAATADAVRELDAGRAIIVGGPAAVSESVEATLGIMLGEDNVMRIHGATRLQTCERIYEYGDDLQGDYTPHWSGTAFVATSENFPDALSASAFAFANKSPIVLADPDSGLTERGEDILKYGGFDEIVILGQSAAVDYDVERWLATETDATVSRIGGGNRYETSKLVADWVLGHRGYTCDRACIATGRNFPDALAGGPLAGGNRTVMLLADEGSTDAFSVLGRNSGSIERIYYLGGLAALPQPLRWQAEYMAGL